MWELNHKENWAPKNWCFWTVVLQKTLESPLDCKEIKPVIWKEINPKLMMKLKLQYFGHLMQTANSLEKTLMLGKIEGERRRGRQDETVGWHQWTWVWANSGSWWWTRKPGVLHAEVCGVVKSWIQVSDWTTTLQVKTQVRRGEATCLKSHSYHVAQLRLRPR